MLVSLLLAHAYFAQDITPIHHALIVGISDYAKAGDATTPNFWPNLTGDQDATLVRDTLVAINRFKSDEIHVITGTATKAQVVKEFKTWLAPQGRAIGHDDVFYFHFSGHGYRFNSDEAKGLKGAVTNLPLDGARTGLVFSDSKGGDLTRLLTNVEFSDLLQPLQNANLTIALDACHSGSGTSRGVLQVRGRTEPGLTPDAGSQSFFAGPASWIQQDVPGFYGASHPAYTVFSACQFDQEAFDTGHGGLFTVNYVKALRDLAAESAANEDLIPSYQELFDKTRNLMMGDTQCEGLQTPVIEGTKERKVFGTTPLEAPNYYSTVFSNGSLQVEAGLLFGLRDKEHLDLYEPGSTPVNGGKKLATVEVSEAKYNVSTVTVTSGAAASGLGDKWAFPANDAVDPGAVALAFDPALAPQRAEYTKSLTDAKIAYREAAAGSADVVLCKDGSGNSLVFKDKAYNPLRTFAPSDLAAQVKDLDRWRGVSLLESPGASSCPTFDVEIVPIETMKVGSGEQMKALITPATTKFAGSDRFAIRVKSEKKGGFSPYLAILQLTPNRSVGLFWPGPGEAETAGIVPADGEWHWLNQFRGTTAGTAKIGTSETSDVGVWDFITDRSQLTDGASFDGVGTQLFKVFATKEFVDYQPLLTRSESRGDVKLTALGELMKAYSNGQRGPLNVPDVFSVSQVAVESVAKP